MWRQSANHDSVYIGETARKFGKRLSEHVTNVGNNATLGVRTRSTRLRNTGTQHKSAITDHVVDHNHVPDWENSKIVCKESALVNRQMLESITIRRNVNTMNRDDGAYPLSTVYNSLLRPGQATGGPRKWQHEPLTSHRHLHVCDVIPEDGSQLEPKN